MSAAVVTKIRRLIGKLPLGPELDAVENAVQARRKAVIEARKEATARTIMRGTLTSDFLMLAEYKEPGGMRVPAFSLARLHGRNYGGDPDKRKLMIAKFYRLDNDGQLFQGPFSVPRGRMHELRILGPLPSQPLRRAAVIAKAKEEACAG